MESKMTPKAAKFLNTQLRFRDACQQDVAFIFNSWLKSNRHSAGLFDVPTPVYFAQHHLLIEGLLKNCTTTMACNVDDASQIFGFIVYETVEGTPVIHYIYVKEPYRQLGLGRVLTEQAQIDINKPFFTTHRTKVMRILDQKFPVIFNPYLAFYGYAAGRALKAEELAEKWAPNPKSEAKHRANIMAQVDAVKAAIGSGASND